jgi:hypothetical protein
MRLPSSMPEGFEDPQRDATLGDNAAHHSLPKAPGVASLRYEPPVSCGVCFYTEQAVVAATSKLKVSSNVVYQVCARLGGVLMLIKVACVGTMVCMLDDTPPRQGSHGLYIRQMCKASLRIFNMDNTTKALFVQGAEDAEHRLEASQVVSG